MGSGSATKWQSALVLGMAALAAVITPARGDTLVYDHNTVHQFAVQAAQAVDPGGTVVANANTFDALLVSQAWDAVLVDAPSTIPVSGWVALINYVNGGGRVALSYWDWDADPALATAFDVGVTSSFSVSGRTLTDMGTSSVFAGVTMPNSDWHDHWSDDGDGFNFVLGQGAVGLAALTGVSGPVMALSNEGRTIAAFVIDEAGASWEDDATQLWKNMYLEISTDAAAAPLPLAGVAGTVLMGSLAALRVRRTACR